MNKSTIKKQQKISKKYESKYILDMGLATFDRQIYCEPIKVYNMNSGKVEVFYNDNKCNEKE